MAKQAIPERRQHLRLSYVWPVRFCEADNKSVAPSHPGKCKNLSQGGMKITALQPLKRDTTILMDTDLNRLSIHIRLKDILIASKERLLAQVAWRHLNLETGLFEMGLRFIQAHRRREFGGY